MQLDGSTQLEFTISITRQVEGSCLVKISQTNNNKGQATTLGPFVTELEAIAVAQNELLKLVSSTFSEMLNKIRYVPSKTADEPGNEGGSATSVYNADYEQRHEY